jgi:hypothetical protein
MKQARTDLVTYENIPETGPDNMGLDMEMIL